MNQHKFEIKSVHQLNLAIKSLEQLISSRVNQSSIKDRKRHSKKIDLLTNAIESFKSKTYLKYAIFKNDMLIGIFGSRSAIGGVRKLECSMRNQLNLDFSIRRTFLHKKDFDYSVAILSCEIDTHSAIGKHQRHIPIFASTMEYFYIEDKPENFDLCCPKTA